MGVATIRLGVALAAAAIVAAGPIAPIAARPPAPASSEVEAWLALARRHEPGAADGSLTEVMGWPRERLDRVVATALVAPDLTRLPHALSLHTDIAIVERTMNASAGGGADVAIEVVDGRQARVLVRSFHWTIARTIAAGLADRPDQAERVAAWYRAVAAMLQHWQDCDLLEAHLASAHRVVGRDAVLALYQGTLHQAYADPRLQRYVAQALNGLDPAARAAMRRGGVHAGERTTGTLGLGRVGGRTIDAPAAGIPFLPRSAASELGDAERWLRRALALDPTLVEARIRLAHVLGNKGDHARAVETLGPVDEGTLPPFSAFYAAMVRGRSAEHLGRYPEADAAYARAAALFPGAQSVEIGRSRTALAQGRTAEALTTVVAVAGPGAAERDDPWTSYLRRHDPDAQTLLQAWRDRLP